MIKDFFTSLPRNFIQSFAGRNLWWHFLAISLTAVIVLTGLDWQYFLAVRNPVLNSVFMPALLVGFLLPVLLPLGLLMVGEIRKRRKISVFGAALFQAAALGWLISSLCKSFTGRVQPDLLNLAIDSSRNWNFGFWEHGIFWGWPSSHTTVAFALSVALIVLVGRKRKAIVSMAIIYAFYVGFATSLGIHWLSEFVAGAIIGSVIGVVVGRWWKGKLAEGVGGK